MTVSKQDIINAFNFRFAAKQYDPNKKIDEADFNVILESARLSPSSYGFEPWNIIVAQDELLRAELGKAGTWGARGTLPTASHFVIMTAKTGEALQSDGVYLTHIMKDIKHMPASALQGTAAKYLDWQQNDFALTTPELLHQWAARQAYIALGNMMTVAAFRGIDSQPIEGFNIKKITAILANRDLINPAIDAPVVMVSFGYRTAGQPEKTRRSLDEIVIEA